MPPLLLSLTSSSRLEALGWGPFKISHVQLPAMASFGPGNLYLLTSLKQWEVQTARRLPPAASALLCRLIQNASCLQVLPVGQQTPPISWSTFSWNTLTWMGKGTTSLFPHCQRGSEVECYSPATSPSCTFGGCRRTGLPTSPLLFKCQPHPAEPELWVSHCLGPEGYSSSGFTWSVIFNFCTKYFKTLLKGTSNFLWLGYTKPG